MVFDSTVAVPIRRSRAPGARHERDARLPRRCAARGPPRGGPALPDDPGGEGRPALPLDADDERGRHPGHRDRRLDAPLHHARAGRGPLPHPLQPARHLRGPRDGPVAERRPGDGRGHPPRHPGHPLHRPAPHLHRQHRRVLQLRRLLRLAGGAGSGRHRRPRARPPVRRHRPPRVPRRRLPRRPAPADRPGQRTPLGPPVRHLRLGRPADGRARGGVRARPAGPKPRTRFGLRDGQALPRRRPPEGRRGPALRARQGAGLSGRHARAPPGAVPGGDRRRVRADDAVLRPADGHGLGGGRLRLQQGPGHRPAPRGARLRGDRLRRLGAAQRRDDLRAGAPGARLGPGAPGRGRAGGPAAWRPAATSSAASSAPR